MNENHIRTRRSENIARSDKRKTDIVNPDKFDGSASWMDFKSHFEFRTNGRLQKRGCI